MPLTQKTDVHVLSGALIFDMYDEEMGAVRVTVEREALDDYAGHRGISGTRDEIWEVAFPDLLQAASDKYDRDGRRPHHIHVLTTDVNH